MKFPMSFTRVLPLRILWGVLVGGECGLGGGALKEGETEIGGQTAKLRASSPRIHDVPQDIFTMYPYTRIYLHA